MKIQEVLPNIDIAIKTDGNGFLERISEIAERSRCCAVERHYNAMGNTGFHIVNFRPLNPLAETNVGGQLIVHSNQPHRVAIEMRASCWLPDPPTRASYSAAARMIFFPLLQEYNQLYGTCYRIRIAKPPRPFRLGPEAAELLSNFCVSANTRGLHPLDWQRSYDSVSHSRIVVPASTMRQLLVQAGFSATEAERLADIYVHLAAFKRQC